MKFSEAWLREWVNPDIDTDTLCQQLTMAGLEVGSVEPAAPDFSSVVIAEVSSVQAHPDADKLRVCMVNDGAQELQIVCGASNVTVGLKVPLIKIGGYLTASDGKQFKIKKSKLRGVESNGMLCSAVEIGLADSSEGLLELPQTAPVGDDIRSYLQLDDTLIEVELTPNRGDCLSLRGIAREVAALNKLSFTDKTMSQIDKVSESASDIMPITIHAPENCLAFAGRIVKNINPKAETPVWMQEKLRRSGLRPIHPVVDISNYVMLETGQPTHTFDLRVLDERIDVRFAKIDEELTLLDGKEVTLDNDVLVIADKSKVLAMAGIMGGEFSGIADDTQDVFIECAHFTPLTIASKARRYGLHTDASHRYERGVDPALLEPVVERITQLLIEIVGGDAGPVNYVGKKINSDRKIKLEHNHLESLLGIAIEPEFVVTSLNQLDVKTVKDKDAYLSTVPTHRFDLDIPEDLIEEVGRLHGLSNIQSQPLSSAARLKLGKERNLQPRLIKQLLVDRGYAEVITYSFISEDLHKRFGGSDTPLRLQNPISSELSIMRESLVPSLVESLLFNLKRQQERVLLFEIGSRYSLQDNEIKEEKTLTILRSGAREVEQWGEKTRSSDFFDLKADVEAVLKLTGDSVAYQHHNEEHGILHPGRSVGLYKVEIDRDSSNNDTLSCAKYGQLHPSLQKAFGLDQAVYIAEIPYKLLSVRRLPAFEAVSVYPASRRDLSLTMPEQTSSESLLTVANDNASAILQRAYIFDVYQGKGVETGQKSVGLGLIFQEKTRTLTDEEIDAAIKEIVVNLSQKLNAVLRDG